VATYDRIAGVEHPAAAMLLVELAEVRLRLGDAERARAACRRVLAFEAAPAPGGGGAEVLPYRRASGDPQPLRAEIDRARSLLARMSAGEAARGAAREAIGQSRSEG
jgi:hypothetical protein